MVSDFVGSKRRVQFINSSDIDEPDDIEHVHIAANRQTLYNIGAYILIMGARFPGKGQVTAPISFNNDTSQALMYIGLELMGAHELLFEVDWTESEDNSYYASWEHNTSNLGLWTLHLQYPHNGGSIISDVSVTPLGCEEEATAEVIDNVLMLGIPRGCDGNNGVDGREVEFRNNGTYIQWEYTTDDTWHNLVALSDITGSQGAQGEQGIAGLDGADGVDGTDANQPPDNGMEPSNDTRCAVATECAEAMYNMFTGALKFNSTQRSEILGGSAGIGLIAGIIFPGLGVIIASGVALAALYNTLLDIEASGLIPYFDNDVKEEIRDKLYCILDISGTYTQDVHNAWKASIGTSDSLHTYIGTVMDLSGISPFQWAASSAPLLASPSCDDSDCPDCTWEDCELTLPMSQSTEACSPNPTCTGDTYTVVISGVGAHGGTLQQDAFYANLGSPTWQQITGGGQTLQMWRNGAPFSPVPDFRSDHIYTITGLSGSDVPICFVFHDSDYSDNSGTYTITITKET